MDEKLFDDEKIQEIWNKLAEFAYELEVLIKRVEELEEKEKSLEREFYK